MLRVIGGILAGLALAFACVFLLELVGQALFPLPAGVNPRDPAALAKYAAGLPPGALLLVMFGWILGAFTGSWTAARIGRRAAPAAAVGALVIAGAAANMVMIPHPIWFWVTSLVLVAMATVAGAAAGARRRQLLVR